jgi:putative SOS response-associated peptidase YedK
LRADAVADDLGDVRLAAAEVDGRKWQVCYPRLRRRCLVPIDNFYEWKKTAAGKQPYAIALADRRLMALAGLWETWRSPAGERVRSFAIITTTPNELCAELHNRMPVVLKPEGWPAWLGEEPADAPQLEALLAPYPSEEMVAWPVSPRVATSRTMTRA